MNEAKLQEIEARIPSAATQCMWCDRLATLRCKGCGGLLCDEHRDYLRDGSSCADDATEPVTHDHATADRTTLVAEVRRLTAALAAVTAERDALADGAECVRLALLDVVRHITADPCDSDEALATPTARLVAVIDESADELRATIDRACEERDEARAALATARREGAEEMRWEASEAAEQWLREVAEVTEDSPADLADAIRALPLDAPGGAT